MASNQSSTKPIAIYARISKDRAGRSEGVKAQEKWGREYVAERWPNANVLVFTDNDLSAADEKVFRPAFERLRQAIRHGDIGGLWTVEQSRLTRREIEWFSLAADLVTAEIYEVHTNRDGIVQVDDDVAGIKSVLNAGETRRNKKRTRDKHAVLASEGRPSGPPGYGYRMAKDKHGRSTYVIEPSEAKIVREIARRIINDESLIKIGEDLTRRKIPTSRGGRWRWNTITAVVTKPTAAGLRPHNGGPLIKAVWPAILDRKTWDKVQALLHKQERTVTGSDGVTRRINRSRRTYQRHLLTGGIAVCGRCGTAMVVQTARPRTDRKDANGKPKYAREAYVCPDPHRGGCGRNSIAKDDLDRWITELVQISFLGTDVSRALAKQKGDPRTPLLSEIGRLQRELDELADLEANGGITLREWKRMRDPKAARLEKVEEQLRLFPAIGTIGATVDAIVDEWDGYTIPQRKRVINLLWREIRVLPARERVKGRRTVPNPEVDRRPFVKVPGFDRFDPRRLKFVSASGKERTKIDDKIIAGLVEAVGE